MGEKRSGTAEFVTKAGMAVSLVLLVAFLVGVGGVVFGAGNPPLLPDPAPTASPALVCAGTPVTPGTSGATTRLVAEDTSPPTSGLGSAGQAAAQRGAASASDIVTCPAGDLQYAPQFRGGYDPNARLMALLAAVIPLLTTVVGFYFGQRAGASSGEADKQKVVSEVLGTDNSATISDLKDTLKAKGLA